MLVFVFAIAPVDDDWRSEGLDKMAENEVLSFGWFVGIEFDILKGAFHDLEIGMRL